MKILHVVSSYWPAFQFGGPIYSVHLLNKELVKKEVDVTVYTTNVGLKDKKDIIFKKETIIDGVKVFYFPYYGYVHFTFSPALFWALAKNIKNFDLVHITGVWNFPVCAAAFWARFYRKPYIISPRGSLMKEPLEKKSSLKKKIHLFLIAKRDLKNAAAIHFTVEREKEEYLRAGLPLKKAIIIPNGFSSEEFNMGTSDVPNIDVNTRTSDVQKLDFRQKFGINTDKKIVLFLSRLNWKKGLDTLIPAFAEVIKKEPNVVLVLAGPDENNYKKEVESKIENCKLKIGKDVIFTGMLVGEDKISALRESDVFVLPSYSENFGMSVVEAMECETPVVISNKVGIYKEVERNKAGIVVEINADSLYKGIKLLLDNPSLRKEISVNARKLVEEYYNIDKVAERMIEAYEEILSAKFKGKRDYEKLLYRI